MESGLVTLLAALIAAIVSVISLIFNFLNKFSEEKRELFRKRLEPIVEELGANLYSLIAATVLLERDKRNKNSDYWHEKIEKSRKTLRKLRPKVRYPLWGIDEGLRMMITFPDLIYAKKIQNKRQIIVKATRLRNSLDNVIRKCYQFGRGPNFLERQRIRYWSSKLKSEWVELRELIEEEELRNLQGRGTQIKYPKIYATITTVSEEDFFAEDKQKNTYNVKKRHKRGKGSSSEIIVGKEVKLFKREGEDFFRFRFVGG